jgi:16S rRNA (guanine(1405)-N(7))-methyltransferase
MPLQAGAEYRAYDVYEDLIAFLGEAMRLSGVVAHASCQDVTRLGPTGPVDVALILKAVPCLDQLDRSGASRLLDVVDARHFLISFPVRSLGGREKGMVATYEARMERLLAGRTWHVRRLEFATELAFLVSR